jgi:hypothetical protein
MTVPDALSEDEPHAIDTHTHQPTSMFLFKRRE